MEIAILVGFGDRRRQPGAHSVSQTPTFTAEESLSELASLAETANACVAGRLIQIRDRIDPATLIGSGKVAELKQLVAAHSADVVIFDTELTPTQMRNLDRELDAKVVDRTQLILDIFASRARTREGKLQVELAQLNYLLPRLAGRGTQMSRLGGGIGTRGPGETQLETDRRKIARRIKKIREDLERVRSGRGIQRARRQSVPLATVALAGYTNAGKSTLFNRLTGSSGVADARMFATLDPTVRQLLLPSRRKVLLADTVGFIRNLPTTLIRAFRATLEEVAQASLIVHVVDASSPQSAAYIEHVREVLKEIGAVEIPSILVLNKMDAPGAEANRPPVSQVAGGALPVEPAVALSARTGEGIDGLLTAIDERLAIDPVQPIRVLLPVDDGASLNLLREHARVTAVRYTDKGCEVHAEAPESIRRQFAQQLL